MNPTPKEVMMGRLASGTRLAQIVLKVKEDPGSAGAVAEGVSGMGAVIRQSAYFSVPGEGYAIYNVLLELTDPAATGEKVATALRSSPSVIEADSAEGTQFGVLDTLSFPILWGGKRLLYMNQRAISGVFHGIQTTFGSGGDFILFQAGTVYGKEFEESMIRAAGRENLRGNFGYTIGLLGAAGWGVPDVIEVDRDRKRAVIALKQCFECEGTKSERAVCSFIRGVFVGASETLFGDKVQSEETKCVAKGDPWCEFVFNRSR